MSSMPWYQRAGIAVFCVALSMVCSADVVRVAVAANFMQPMQALGEHFTAASGHELRLSFGSSGAFYAQISNGAPFDILLSADRAIPERLEREGKAVAGSRFTYARGRLVLWSADSHLIDAEALASEPAGLLALDFRRLALANAALAPYGRAAEQVLEAIDPAATLAPRVVRGDNVAQVFQFVSSGNAELGFVAYSQVLAAGSQQLRSGSGWIIPDTLHAPIEQDAVWLQQGADKPAAAELVEFLRSAEGKAIIAAHGYTTPD